MKKLAAAESEKLQLESFCYFPHETNSLNGLVVDNTAAVEWTPASLGTESTVYTICISCLGK